MPSLRGPLHRSGPKQSHRTRQRRPRYRSDHSTAVLTQPETLQVELTPAPPRGDAKQFVRFIDSLPPGTMTKEERRSLFSAIHLEPDPSHHRVAQWGGSRTRVPSRQASSSGVGPLPPPGFARTPKLGSGPSEPLTTETAVQFAVRAVHYMEDGVLAIQGPRPLS